MWVLRRRWRELLAIYAVMVYCTLLHGATHAEARLSEPLLPLLVVLIAGAFIAVLRGSSPDVHGLLAEASSNGPEDKPHGQGLGLPPGSLP